MKDRSGAREEKGIAGTVETEKKAMRERGVRTRKRRRQSTSVAHLRNAMAIFLRLLSMEEQWNMEESEGNQWRNLVTEIRVFIWKEIG